MNTINFLNQNDLPGHLLEIYKPPNGLYYQGDLEILKKPLISIIGTRKNTEYGEFLTKKILNELAGFDIGIVSGLAKGIDTLAHTYALKNDLKTIAILGSGLENIYPRENQKLAEKIVEQNGLLISEYENLTPPLQHHFPARNRIISGLSLATLVIEAPEKSGSLITAKLALEQGKEVFVIPGDIDRENSLGNLKLLQTGGAYPISSGREIIEMLNLPANQKEKPKEEKITYQGTIEERIILENLNKKRGLYLDELKQLCKLPINDLLANLTLLEINGLIQTKHGKYIRNC